MMHKLEADSIQLEFRGRRILSSIYLSCEIGKITGLLGRNGQGKSCLMKIIYGSLTAERSIRIDGVPQYELFKQPGLLRYLPQFNFIPPSITLKRIFSDFALDYSLFARIFPEFASMYRSPIAALSGGGYRLVELYVILSSSSQFVMLDEPFTHLSPIQIAKAKELLMQEKQHKGLLITDHLYQHVQDVCDHLYVLSDGGTHLTRGREDLARLGYTGFDDQAR